MAEVEAGPQLLSTHVDEKVEVIEEKKQCEANCKGWQLLYYEVCKDEKRKKRDLELQSRSISEGRYSASAKYLVRK